MPKVHKKNTKTKQTPLSKPNKNKSSAKIQNDFPIVAIGASAGGFKAFTEFFKNIPANTGMAFVVIQHLDPQHTSQLSELMKKLTDMSVTEVKDNTKVKPNHVYVIPPSKIMNICKRTLKLDSLQKGQHPGITHSIDIFLRSASEDLEEKSIAVLLSGSGNDGIFGARAIKSKLGLVLVQDPNTADYTGIPQAAIDAGVADYVCPPQAMGQKLINYIETSFGKKGKRLLEIEADEKYFEQIFSIIRRKANIDFSQYKQSTVRRRISRRMNVLQLKKIQDYLKCLHENPQEIEALVKDFLINVTSFFRDPQAFNVLKKHIKKFLKDHPEKKEIRAWTAGCSTGEEAYSMAITILECIQEMKTDIQLQVFATDLDPDAIDDARKGIYPISIIDSIDKTHLKKYFHKQDNHIQIKRIVREMIVFSEQDFINDPPFSNIDIISARNILIYFKPEVQKQKLIPMLYYALNKDGILFLGTAETIGEIGKKFEVLDRKWKIYKSKNKKEARIPPGNITRQWGMIKMPVSHKYPKTVSSNEPHEHMSSKYETLILSGLEPSVLVNEQLEVIYAHGNTSNFLKLPQGKPNMNIMQMIRDELRIPMNSCLIESKKKNQRAIREGLRIGFNGDTREVKIIIKPVKNIKDGEHEELYIITFYDSAHKKGTKSAPGKDSTQLKQVQDELKYTKESLHTTIEELETANEELRSANEEYQSTNEELQSTNEELETSREELQSLNEELVTVNNEHQKKIEELYVTNDDMKNLLNSTGIATIFLDKELTLIRYTSKATELFNFIDTDIGRPLKHITSQINYTGIAHKSQIVIDNLTPVEREVRTKNGNWYSMRIYPYRTTQDKISGVVISFIDITAKLRYAQAIINTMRHPVLMLDEEFLIILANRSFYKLFKTSAKETENEPLLELDEKQWDIPELKKLLKDILPKRHTIEDFKFSHDFARAGKKTLLLNAQRLATGEGRDERILLAMEEIRP